jgi:hypothetical protein
MRKRKTAPPLLSDDELTPAIEAVGKVINIRLSVLHPSPENDWIYRQDDEAIQELADRMKKEGQLEPLIVTADNYIVAGHRRYAALLLNKETFARCIRLQVERRSMSKDDYVRLLRAHNRQREKTADEKVREELIDITPDTVDSLYRRRQAIIDSPSQNGVQQLRVEGSKRRYEISEDKAEHVKNILKVLEERRAYWPLSDRGVHYQLLNYHFVRGYYHPRREDEDWGGPPRVLRYMNDRHSYQATVDLLVRLRLDGTIPWEALADPTRPVKEFRPFDNIRKFVQQQKDKLFVGY